MRNVLAFLGVVSLTALFTAGCVGPEQKLGRGVSYLSDPLYDTDTYVGFNGGAVVPFIPGGQFSVFDN